MPTAGICPEWTLFLKACFELSPQGVVLISWALIPTSREESAYICPQYEIPFHHISSYKLVLGQILEESPSEF